MPPSPALPDAVAFPQTGAEVQAILAACRRHGGPVTAFGIGSSMEGHTLPVRGGLTLSTRRMNRIREGVAEDRLAMVEPGVTRLQLNTEVRATGLQLPVDPGADATLGGMASTRGSGTIAVRYGTMRENVPALRVVTADGAVIRTGSRARKSSTGYDLAHLFVGAEGTLGIITEPTVRLHPIPEAVRAAVAAFPTVAAAIDRVIETAQAGIPVARAEFLDEVAIGGVHACSGLGLPVAPTLSFEFHGSPQAVAEQAARVQEIAEGQGATGFRWSADADERARLWKARHDLFRATKALKPGAARYTGDIGVPISHLAGQIVAAREDIDASPLIGRIIGHSSATRATETSAPPICSTPPTLPRRPRPRAWPSGWWPARWTWGGTASGAHGIGLVKPKWLRAEHGDAAVETMAAIKAAPDPAGILDPGKLGQGA